jgi:hypothetical protein
MVIVSTGIVVLLPASSSRNYSPVSMYVELRNSQVQDSNKCTVQRILIAEYDLNIAQDFLLTLLLLKLIA